MRFPVNIRTMTLPAGKTLGVVTCFMAAAFLAALFAVAAFTPPGAGAQIASPYPTISCEVDGGRAILDEMVFKVSTLPTDWSTYLASGERDSIITWQIRRNPGFTLPSRISKQDRTFRQWRWLNQPASSCHRWRSSGNTLTLTFPLILHIDRRPFLDLTTRVGSDVNT